MTDRLLADREASIPALVLALLFISCEGGPPAPVEPLLDEDACSYCRMAVSDGRLSAQVARRGGVEHFDDIGCLLDWLDEHGLPPGGVAYVTDYRTGDPLPAPAAFYLRSPLLPTPMGHGLAAFSSVAAAEKAAVELGGSVLDWETLRASHGGQSETSSPLAPAEPSDPSEPSASGGRRQPDER